MKGVGIKRYKLCINTSATRIVLYSLGNTANIV